MMLSAQTIRKHVAITPFCETSVGPLGLAYGLGSAHYTVRLQSALKLDPGGWDIGMVLEHIELPSNMIGMLHSESSWPRQGVTIEAQVVNAGWHGWPTIKVKNHLPRQVAIPAGSPIAQLRVWRV